MASTTVKSAVPVTLSQARRLMDHAQAKIALSGYVHYNYFENSTYRKGLRVVRSQIWYHTIEESRKAATQVKDQLSRIAPQGSYRVSVSRKYATFIVSIFYASHSK